MLCRRGAFKASTLLCYGCGRLCLSQAIKHAPTPLLLPRRSLHATPPSSGPFWNLLKTERHMKYIHKEIGKILEDYDKALDRYFFRAKEYYHKYYLSGSREDLIRAYWEIAALYRLTSRVEEYIKTNEFLKRTAVPRIFDENDVQQQSNAFLKAISEIHGDDPQYRYIMKEVNNMKVEPLETVEKPLSNARIAGWFVKIFNWIRNREVRVLRTEYERTMEFFAEARSTGRRKHIDAALGAAQRLQKFVEERYAGKLWEEENKTGEVDPRFKRTDENLEELNKLKGDIEGCIKQIRSEFMDALPRHDGTRDSAV